MFSLCSLHGFDVGSLIKAGMQIMAHRLRCHHPIRSAWRRCAPRMLRPWPSISRYECAAPPTNGVPSVQPHARRQEAFEHGRRGRLRREGGRLQRRGGVCRRSDLASRSLTRPHGLTLYDVARGALWAKYRKRAISEDGDALVVLASRALVAVFEERWESADTAGGFAAAPALGLGGPMHREE
ncbi:hypothetical protein Mesci_5056 [Mesorhizobium ciceri biovar biserrulae WSM1271]|uniref:Uncharacterized protein n=1 Tax=Mesorhizobium ciceri biovar biserrulae (strain HAMBI 2942 / LMG 23838 / WSM1271) TaxID=765698 RepID=E8T8Z8_MESCW|nr:hypothetical protein Mesci_5056 [Mesorhizobium ciceri biovar biserrulae WSM1271]